jgi:hypothetical protein
MLKIAFSLKGGFWIEMDTHDPALVAETIIKTNKVQ